MPFKFEKLEIWKSAIDLADEVHNLTRNFPKEEMFSLSSQMKRAADSISLNIAEGSTGQSDPEQLKFLGYSQRSGLEVVNCLYLAIRRHYIDQQQFDRFYSELERLIVKIQAFKNSIKNKP
ncbi:MAG TPA: four helix bundle protein [Ferruginibacter sp.]|nr:four helix bundle protein [Ferruginibacter sp.]